MKKLYFIFFWLLFLFQNKVFASDAWILWDWINWVSAEQLREGKIHIDDIPKILIYATDFLMWIRATIAIIFIIIGAYQLLLWPLDWNKTKWKETILLALWWLVLASLAWVILKAILDNFW